MRTILMEERRHHALTPKTSKSFSADAIVSRVICVSRSLSVGRVRGQATGPVASPS